MTTAGRYGVVCAAIAGLVAASCRGSNDVGSAAATSPPPVQQSASTQPSPSVTPSTPAARLDAAAEYDKGSALAAAGKLAEARAVFDGAHAQDPGEEAVAAAVEIFQDMDAGHVSADAVQRMFRAFEQGNAGQWQSAHEDADEVLRLAPRYARAHATKGGLYVLQGPAQYPNAIKSFDQALKVAPQFAEAYYSRGAVRAEMQQFDAAIADYNRAIELQPSTWYAYRNRGSAHANKNELDAAIADYSKAYELRPTDADSLLLRATVYGAARQPDAARADLEKVIALSESSPQAEQARQMIAALQQR